MADLFKIRNIFFGQKTIPSRSEYKRLMLTIYMSLTCMVIAVFYSIIDIWNNVFYAFPAYALLFCTPLITLVLVRLNMYKAGKIMLIISTNLVVLWSALNDPFATGVFMFFIPAGIGSFAILEVSDYKTGFALAGFTTILFFIAYFWDYQPMEYTEPSDDYIRLSFILNYFISLTVSVLAVYFLMNLNKHSENELIKKEALANERNAELLKVNAELDRFVYSVSHDLRSPLSSILGLTTLAQKTTNQNELNDILNMIRGRVNAQDHFIKDIIDYARNTRTEVVAEAVDLEQLVDDVIGSLRYNTNAEKINFRKKIPEQTVIHTDRIRLTIVLNNLLSNAIKYHDFNKLQPYIEIGYIYSPRSIYVKDNGIGILPEHITKIFNMFYRGSDRSTGSGLGLFITKETVTKMGGTLEVKSVFGEGSVFTIYVK